jgi:hypothetical protein
MSAVTLLEIAEFVAAKFSVPLADMRELRKGRTSDAETERARRARNVVIALAKRHTKVSLRAMAAFFHLSLATVDRVAAVANEPDRWLAGDAETRSAVEIVEQQIDALHERRLALRDNGIVPT